jgi:hypothetical protein
MATIGAGLLIAYSVIQKFGEKEIIRKIPFKDRDIDVKEILIKISIYFNRCFTNNNFNWF